MNLDTITATVTADIAVIMGLSSLLGAAARKIGQPAVVGQIITGIILGPSLLGHLPGHLMTRLLPADVLPYLNVLAQVGVVVFMFVAAYEVGFGSMTGRSRSVSMLVIAALFVPMALGSGSAVVFRSMFAAVSPHSHSGHSFILYVGVATAITALPVLAAIVRERGIASTTPGLVAMSAAGGMDVLAWLALAAAIAGTSHSSHRSWLVTSAMIVGWAALMMLVARPALRWWFSRSSAVLAQQLPVAIILTMTNAYVTTSLGLHAVFGGFLAGLVMPRIGGAPDIDVLRAMESASTLLLPLFFVGTGLSLNISALGTSDLGLLAIIIVIASAGKLGPSYAAARVSGLSSRQSATVAALLNTRGLTELIALNIGLQSGIISARLFTIFVLMALVTTASTGPLLSLIGRGSARRQPDGEQACDGVAQAAGADGFEAVSRPDHPRLE